jgi:hypothetical protein
MIRGTTERSEQRDDATIVASSRSNRAKPEGRRYGENPIRHQTPETPDTRQWYLNLSPRVLVT